MNKITLRLFVDKCDELRNGHPSDFYAHVDRFCKCVRHEQSQLVAIRALRDQTERGSGYWTAINDVLDLLEQE